MRRYFSSTVTRFELGRMRGDHRADAQARQERLDHARRHALGGGLGQHMVERAAQARPPARPLDLPAPAHGGVLLGDGEKLEPDALRLQRARHQLGREAVDIGAALEHRLDLGLMLAHHLDEEGEQELGRFLGRGAADRWPAIGSDARGFWMISSFMAGLALRQ